MLSANDNTRPKLDPVVQPSTPAPIDRPRPPRAQQARTLERQQAIVETTWQLISQRGFEATSVNTIIRELGISKGSFYHHFRSKAAVLDALVEKLTTDVSRRVQENNAHAPAITRLNAFIQSGWQWHEEHAAISAEMFTVMLRPENSTLMLQITATEQRVFRPLLEDIISQGIAEQSFEVPNATIATDFLMPLLSDSLLRIARAAINGDLNTTRFVAQIDFLRVSLERMLGAAPGSLAASIPDEHAMGLVVEFLSHFQTAPARDK